MWAFFDRIEIAEALVWGPNVDAAGGVAHPDLARGGVGAEGGDTGIGKAVDGGKAFVFASFVVEDEEALVCCGKGEFAELVHMVECVVREVVDPVFKGFGGREFRGGSLG